MPWCMKHRICLRGCQLNWIPHPYLHHEMMCLQRGMFAALTVVCGGFGVCWLDWPEEAGERPIVCGHKYQSELDMDSRTRGHGQRRLEGNDLNSIQLHRCTRADAN
jgi:hypothetical protein